MSGLVYGWLTGLMAGLPLGLGYALASLLTEVHFRLFPARRHAALINLAAALPGTPRRERLRIVRRMMRSYNCMLFEFFRLPHLGREDLLNAVEVVGREHLEDAVARGRGVIVTCTHIGNWELAGVVLAHWGYTLHAVAGVQFNRWLSPAVRDARAYWRLPSSAARLAASWMAARPFASNVTTGGSTYWSRSSMVIWFQSPCW